MGLLHAFLLGILQGIGGFLPISSSAHLILAPALTSRAGQGVAFTGGAFRNATFGIRRLTSFSMTLTAIHFFLKWLNRFGMWPYVVYRLMLAAVIYSVLMN